MDLAALYPFNMDIKYDHICIDGSYVSTIIMLDFNSELKMFDTINSLMCMEDIELSFHYSKINGTQMIKQLTEIIAKSSSEINTIHSNQIDANILNDTKQKALELRKAIQIDNEQIYKLSLYICVKACNIANLKLKVRRVVDILYANQIVVKPANFRQKEAYIGTLPFNINETILSKYNYNILTESSVATLFPYYTSEVQENTGVLLGLANGNFSSIDIFSHKRNNYNMCVFGSSGSGKSYFIKLMLLRNAYKGIRQIIIDPEGEYIGLVNSIGGKCFNSNNFNIFEIDENFVINNSNYFDLKLDFLESQINTIISPFGINNIREIIKRLYYSFGITEQIESMYLANDNDTFYLKSKFVDKFPTIFDFINVIKKDSSLDKRITEKLEDYSKDKCRKYEMQFTDANIFCFDLSYRNSAKLKQDMDIYINKIEELIGENTIIYFDELWKCIRYDKDGKLLEYIYSKFKTLRKRKAGIVIISQDISDIFGVDNGNLGKSILNNSGLKALFKMEWSDIDILGRMLSSNKQLEEIIKGLTRGTAYISMGSINYCLEVKGSEYEHKLIEGRISDEKNISGIR